MNNDKVFLDSVDISDAGPKGYVILTDKNTGKVIFKKHNMVVGTGKRYIFSLLVNQNLSNAGVRDYTPFDSTGSDADFNSMKTLSEKCLTFLEFGIGTNDVTSSDIGITPLLIGSEHPLRFYIVNKNSTDSNSDIVKSQVTNLSDKSFIKFEFNFSGSILDRGTGVDNNANRLVSELGLFLGDGTRNSSDNILFSRIRFDTIPITAESNFLLQYYVYF